MYLDEKEGMYIAEGLAVFDGFHLAGELNVEETQISEVIKKLQFYNSDIINFGEEIRVQHQDLWKQLKWKQTFRKFRSEWW